VVSGALAVAGSTYLVLRSRRRARELPRHYAHVDG